MKQNYLYFLLVAALILLENNPVFGESAIDRTNVKVFEIRSRELTVYKTHIGYLKPRRRVIVRSETSGIVESISFEEGQAVKVGEKLVHVSTNELALRKSIAEINYHQALSDYQVEKQLYLDSHFGGADEDSDLPTHASLKQLRLQADLVKADYEQSRSEYNIQKRLFEKGMASTSTYHRYRTNLKMKHIAWQQAELKFQQSVTKDRVHMENMQRNVALHKAQLALANLALDKSVVTAPFNGIITTKTVQLGGFVQQGSELAEIMDISQIMVRIKIPEKQMSSVSVGKPVSIQLDALPGKKYRGTVKTLGLEADVTSRCFSADVLIDNAGKKLLPGMMARVEMQTRSESNQIIVPRHAVLERLQGPVVFVVRDHKAVRVPVVTGVMVEDDIQILQGLAIGDRLIVVGQDLLANKEPVTVMNAHQKLAKR